MLFGYVKHNLLEHLLHLTNLQLKIVNCNTQYYKHALLWRAWKATMLS